MSTPARSRTRRAVSEADKSARRQSILIAADRHFRTVGFEKFSMEVLSKELEVARGTLYRYFSTREELLLNLYQRQQQQFVDRLIESTSKPVSDSEFLLTFYELSVADPTLVALRMRLTSVIEHNVDNEVLLETKLAMMADFEKLSAHMARMLRLPTVDAEQLIIALLALLLGAVQADASPDFDYSAFPAETQRIMRCFAGREVFLSNSALILKGLRAT